MRTGTLETAVADPPAIVYNHVDEEKALIERAREAVNTSMWAVGECAHIWQEKFGQGRSETEFANAIGLDVPTIRKARKVHRRFGAVREAYQQLTFAHWIEASGLEGAEEWLTKADRARMGIDQFREAIQAKAFQEEAGKAAVEGETQEPAEMLPEDRLDEPPVANESDDSDEVDTNADNADFMTALETLEVIFARQNQNGWIDVDRAYAQRKLAELTAMVGGEP